MTNPRRDLDIGLRLASWLLTYGFDRMSREADRRFRDSCDDPILVQYMVSLPLAGLPEIRCGLTLRTAQRGDEALKDVIRAAITRDWGKLSPAQINHAADVYVCCLGRALLARWLVPLTPTALVRDSSRVC